MNARRRPVTIAAVSLLAATVLSSCGNGLRSDALAAAEQRWRASGIVDYTMILTSLCGERALIGRFVVTVDDGEVSAVEGLDDAADWAVDADLALVPTIDELFALLHEARDADEASATYDPDLGHPTSIYLDWHRNAVDDEECYTVSEVG